MSGRRYGARAGDPCPSGRHRLPQGWFPSHGCRGCRNDEALAKTEALVVTILPGAAEEQVRQALSAVTAAGKVSMHAERYRRIGVHLGEHPDALTSGASTTPVDVARLISQLRRLGRGDVAEPRCADCQRPCFPRERRPDGLRICTTCSGRRRYAACGRCGNVRPVCRRLADGTGLCQPCHQADPATWEPCGRCGQQATIRINLRGVRVGDCCYLKPHERCSVCGLGRAVSPYASGKATCGGCTNQPRDVCARCGLDAPAGGSGEPRCLRCHSDANQPCRVCGAATVSRDRDGAPQCSTCIVKSPRTCGGCGRHRVIARRGSGGVPDLCTSCWRGPIVVCDGCRRRRPCRGERAGKMLCKGCAPRPKRPCAYCGQARKVAIIWADGPACSSCYRGFMRAKGTCPQCGQSRRLLPYPGQPQAVCAPCAGAPPGPVCGQCGNEDWLYHKDRCARCVLTGRLTDLLGDIGNRDRLGLQPLFDTLAHAERPEVILGWMRPSASGTAHLLLARLGRGEIPLSHEALDALNTPGNGGTANHLDAILTANGVLPPRDLELARLERAIPAALAAVADHEHRKILRGYATWDLLRHARAAATSSPLTAGARHAAGERLNAATYLLIWLRERGLDFASCRQPDLEAYLVAHPTRRGHLHGFLAWAHRTRRARKLTITGGPKPLPKTPAADDDQRWDLARALLHEPGYTPADRVAGLLVLLFGQRPHRISRLGVNAINTAAGRVTITLGTSPIELPEPLAGHVTTLLATRRARVAKRITDPGPWLFPSQHPDRPALPATITHRLQRLGIQPSSYRAAALLHLAGEMPPAVLGDLLGLGHTAVQDWSTLAGRTWVGYAADRLAEAHDPAGTRA